MVESGIGRIADSLRRSPFAVLFSVAGLAIALGACTSNTESNAIGSEEVEITTSTTEPTTTTTTAPTTESTNAPEIDGPPTDLTATEVGQCFIRPEVTSTVEIDKLATVACDKPHDSQIYYKFETPEDSDVESLLTICRRNGDKVSNEALLELSDETERRVFFTSKQSVCFIYDPDGLETSILAGPSLSLEVGQCFYRPEAFLGGGLESLDCDEPHDAQIYYKFETTEEYDEDAMLDLCRDNSENIAGEALGAMSSEAQRRFYFVDGQALCFIHDPQGLEGSILT